jgi:diguanylate cyclase (GGDEF)-like protein/PAS domain S-box-containing protein
MPIMTPVHDNEFAVLETLFEGAYRVDPDRRITYWNPAAEKLTGFAAGEVVGSRCADGILQHIDANGRHLCRTACPLAETLVDGRSREASVFLHHKLGHRVPVSVRCTVQRDSEGHIIGGLEVFTDASAADVLRQRIDELEQLAYLDRLTQVANRRFADATVDQRLEEYRRYQWPFGVVLFDIDRFKEVNDRWGHLVGDRALAMVANTLAGTARSFDLVARWGGDEFLVVLRNVDEARLGHIAERLRTLVESAFLTLDADTIRVTVSGGSTLAEPGDSPESLVERADRLLYTAKARGRNRVVA